MPVAKNQHQSVSLNQVVQHHHLMSKSLNVSMMNPNHLNFWSGQPKITECSLMSSWTLRESGSPHHDSGATDNEIIVAHQKKNSSSLKAKAAERHWV